MTGGVWVALVLEWADMLDAAVPGRCGAPNPPVWLEWVPVAPPIQLLSIVSMPGVEFPALYAKSPWLEL